MVVQAVECVVELLLGEDEGGGVHGGQNPLNQDVKGRAGADSAAYSPCQATVRPANA
jgi:hypothetical protein